MPNIKNVKISGKAIEPIMKAFINENLAKHIIEEGLDTTELNENEYYSAEKYINTLHIIDERMGSAVLKKVGKFMMETAIWPPNVTNLESGLASINEAYKMNHIPNTIDKIGTYTYKKIEENSFELHCDNPYPCGLDFGIISGVANKFDKHAFVSHKEGECRSKGGKMCVYSIIHR